MSKEQDDVEKNTLAVVRVSASWTEDDGTVHHLPLCAATLAALADAANVATLDAWRDEDCTWRAWEIMGAQVGCLLADPENGNDKLFTGATPAEARAKAAAWCREQGVK